MDSKLSVIFIALAAGTVFCSCGSRNLQRLEAAESLMEDHPDSALMALRAIDTNSLRTDKEKALFSLLNAMALDKNYIDTTDTRIIEPAVKYYTRVNNKDRLAASLFYSGRIEFNAGNYRKAILNFLRVRRKTESVYWKAMATNHISYTYNKCYNNTEELAYSLEALKLWKDYGDSIKIIQTYSSLATAYHNNKNDVAADSLLNLLRQLKPPYFIAYIQSADFMIKRETADYQEIATLFEIAIKNKVTLSLENWYEYAYALFKCGRNYESESVLEELKKYPPSIPSCLWLGKIAKDKGDYKLALKYEEQEKMLVANVREQLLSKSLFKAQSEYYKSSFSAEEQKKEKALLIMTIILLLSSLIVTTIVVGFKQKKNYYQRELDRLNRIYEEASRMIKYNELKSDRSERKLLNLRQKYAEIYKRQFAEIGKFFDYSSKRAFPDNRSLEKYSSTVSEIIEEINSNGKKQQEFEDRINNDLDNIMFKLRNDFPEFNENDFRFISYLIVGFDATTRAIIFNKSINNMRVKKARLIKKIFDKPTANTLLYSYFLKKDK